MHAAKSPKNFPCPFMSFMKGMDYIKMVEKPPHGHAAEWTPVSIGRILHARKVKDDAALTLVHSFVITGEVLRTRSHVSTTAYYSCLIWKGKRLEDLILRPLRAAFPNRRFRNRRHSGSWQASQSLPAVVAKSQFALPQKFGFKIIPVPPEECLLTDKVIAARLRDLFANTPSYNQTDPDSF